MRLTRRQVLRAAALLPAALSAYPDGPGRLIVQAYVFQQLAGKEKRKLVEAIPSIFSTIAKAGFHGVELTDAFFTPETAPATTEALRANGLGLRIVYTGLTLHEAGDPEQKSFAAFQTFLQAVDPLHPNAININPLPKPKGAAKSDEELARQAANLNRMGEMVGRGSSRRLVVHHHEPEMRQDAREWRHILRQTDPKLVWLCMDVDWVLQGGQDPVKLVREAGTRIGSMHLRNSRDKVWLESVGPGDIDYTAVARELEQQHTHPWLVVELAFADATRVTRPIGENLRLSREFAERTFRVQA